MANVIEVVIRATDQASGGIERFGGALGKVAGVAIGTAAAIGAAAAATVAFTSKMVEGIEAVSDAAARLGTSATKLSELHFAADLANVSAESLNNSLQIMQRTAATAAESGGKVAESLSRMGISAKDFSSLPVEQKLGLVADKFSGMADAGQRARLANELFGRSGAQMLQMLNQGSAGLAAAAEEARKFGVVIGPQQAANAKAYGDMLDRVGAAGTGLGRTVASELIPMITGLGNSFANFIAENREAVGAWVGSVIRNLVAFGIVTGQVFAQIKSYVMAVFEPGGVGKLTTDFLTVVYAAFKQMLVGAIVVGKGLITILAEVPKAVSNLLLTGFKVAFLAILDMAVQLGKRLIDAIKGNVPTESLADTFIGVISRASEELSQNVQGDLAGITGAGKQFFDELGTFAADTGTQVGDGLSTAFDIDWSTALGQADEAIAKVSEFGTVAEESIAAAGEFVPGFWSTMQTAADEWLTSHKTAVEEIANSTFDLMMSTAGAIGDAFAQSIVSGKSLGKSLEAIGKQVLTSLIAMLIRVGLQRLILSGINMSAGAIEASQAASSSIALAGSNMFASWAGAPWPISIGAPAAAAAAVTGATAIYAAGAAAGKGAAAGGAFHGGSEFVPSEQSYQLQRGERVLSPRQNTDLTDFLDGGQGGGSDRQINISLDDDGIYSGRAVRKLMRAFASELRLKGVTVNGFTP